MKIYLIMEYNLFLNNSSVVCAYTTSLEAHEHLLNNGNILQIENKGYKKQNLYYPKDSNEHAYYIHETELNTSVTLKADDETEEDKLYEEYENWKKTEVIK